MKISFLTACLEPDRDGVGDYTRMLAGQCAALGHECCLIGIADQYAPGENDAGQGTELLRMPCHLPWEDRVGRARNHLAIFKPDFISFQFVSYSYNKNGLIAGIEKYIHEIVDERPLHIMLHELWIGNYRRAGLKERCVGALQRYFILRMLRTLRPALTTVTIPLYFDFLKNAGQECTILPLFGNIPIAPPNPSWVLQSLRNCGIDIHTSNRHEFWCAGMFGSLHPSWPPEPLLTLLRASANRYRRKLVITSIGRLGPGRELWNKLASLHGDVQFVDLGKQPAPEISAYLQEIDFGIAASPRTVIGKSGTATAMAEHGLPVIVNWDAHETQSSCDLPGWVNLRDGLDLAQIGRHQPIHGLPAVAERFLTALEERSPVPS